METSKRDHTTIGAVTLLVIDETEHYCRPRCSQPHPGHRVYPYRLRQLAIERPHQVWCADITYIPLQRGFLYLLSERSDNRYYGNRTVMGTGPPRAVA